MVAPTSAGKTFVSFYVTEKLKTAPVCTRKGGEIKARIVIITPTDTLGNQMQAELWSRYGDKLSVGVWTPDFRMVGYFKKFGLTLF